MTHVLIDSNVLIDIAAGIVTCPLLVMRMRALPPNSYSYM